MQSEMTIYNSIYNEMLNNNLLVESDVIISIISDDNCGIRYGLCWSVYNIIYDETYAVVFNALDHSLQGEDLAGCGGNRGNCGTTLSCR